MNQISQRLAKYAQARDPFDGPPALSKTMRACAIVRGNWHRAEITRGRFGELLQGLGTFDAEFGILADWAFTNSAGTRIKEIDGLKNG